MKIKVFFMALETVIKEDERNLKTYTQQKVCSKIYR